MDTSATQSHPKLNANQAPARVANLAVGRLEKLAPRPNTLADTGLSEAFLGDLVVKHLFEGGVLTMAALTERLALSGPIIEQIIRQPKEKTPKQLRALILTPTRELAAQVAKDIGEMTVHSKVSIFMAYGGVSINPQKKSAAFRLRYISRHTRSDIGFSAKSSG